MAAGPGAVALGAAPALTAMTAGPARGTRDERIAELFDQHYQGLCRLAVVLLGDPGRAEEVVQEAFVRTYAGWSRIRRPERAQWYLRRAVVNGCRSAARRRVTEDRGNRILAVVDEGGEDEEERAGRVQSVLQAVRALPPRQREAVVLRYYEDLPEATIAATLGCSVGTVKSQLSKARARLARDLGDREEVDGV